MSDRMAYPLSQEQQKIWFQYSLNPDLPVYNIAQLFDIAGPLCLDRFSAAVRQVVRRHPALTVRFHEQDGQMRQTPDPAAVDGPELLRCHPGCSDRADALALVEDLALRPFDLNASLPCRIDIVPFGPEQYLIGFCIHHIVFDGWSSSIFFNDLNDVYRSLQAGDPIALDAPENDYRGYVSWQADIRQKDAVAEQNAYWLDYLNGVTPLLELPVKKRRGHRFDYRGACEVLPLPEDIQHAVGGLARQHGVTPFCIFLTVFSILLQRYSRQQGFCIGYPSANRAMPDSERIVGMFTNTLVHRVEFDPGVTFSQLLAANYASLIDAQENEGVQFEKVLETLGITRDSAFNPLFQVIFLVQDRREAGLQLAGADVEQVRSPVSTAKFDLNLAIDIDSQGTRGVIEYASSVFEADEIRQLWRHYVQLLGSFCRDADQAVGTPALDDKASAGAIAAAVAQTTAQVSIHRRFEQMAGMHADAIAVECGEERLTYAQLDARAGHLSLRLLRHGVTPGTLIGLSMPRGVDLIVGMLAILKAGCGYLPLDPGYPADRLHYMIEDAGCTLAIVAGDATAAMLGSAVAVIAVDGAGDAGDRQPVASVDVAAASVAYCIYTSGSTGKPKGVFISHHNVVRLFDQTRQWFDFDHRDVWTLFHSYSFDFSVWEIFGALLHGGRLVVVPYEVSRSPQDFRALLKARGVTVLNQTPSAFLQLSHVETSECDAADRLDALRHVIFGGEALNLQSLAAWARRYGSEQPQLINMYGITETTVHVTYRRIGMADIESQTRSLIGVPIPDLSIHLFDDAGNPVPAGVAGEIYVGGAGLAIGYHRRDELNRERFVSMTSSDGTVHRLYRSGDLAKRHLDGELEYIGRIDHQVKVRGHRIEIGEIEAQLLLLDDIAQATVLVKADTIGQERLVAWIVAAHGCMPGRAGIRQALATALPAFMIPQDILIVDHIPLTQNGKVDRAVLLAMPVPLALDTQTYEAAGTVRQQQILAAWQAVLQLDRIGIHDNFFSIGGDSIRAVMVAQHCKRQGVPVGVIDLLNHQTIAELAAHSWTKPSLVTAAAGPVLAAASPARERLLQQLQLRQPVYPVSGMQGIIFERYRQHAGDGEGTFHVQQSYRFADSRPDSDAMHAAIAQLVNAHPVLRTVALRADDGQWLQYIETDMVPPLVVHDLRGLPAGAGQEHWIAQFVQQDRRAPFSCDGPSAPLLRFNWFQLSDTSFEIFMSIHHGIDDGWGNQLFLSQLFELYLAIRDGVPGTVPRQANVMLEYVALEQRNASDPGHLQFWARQAGPADAGAWPGIGGNAEKNNPPVEGLLAAEVTMRLDRGARQRHCTLRALLITILQKTVSRTLNRPCPRMGIVMNGRKDELSDPLHSLGLFWNMLPLRLSAGTFDERVAGNHRTLLDMEKFSAFPSDLVNAAEGDGGEAQVTFNFVNFHNGTQYGGSDQLTLLKKYGHDKFHYPLNIFVSFEAATNQLYLKIESDGEFIHRTAVQNVMDAYMADLTRMSVSFVELGKQAA